MPEIASAATVIIAEGEKDADRINELQLRDFTGRTVLATTSGSADSWQDAFADLLAGRRYGSPLYHPAVDNPCVIVMPDGDAHDQEYKNKIVASLKKRSIPHCVISFGDFKDVSEYLDGGHSAEELAQRITEEIAKIGQGGVVPQAQATIEEPVSL